MLLSLRAHLLTGENLQNADQLGFQSRCQRLHFLVADEFISARHNGIEALLMFPNVCGKDLMDVSERYAI